MALARLLERTHRYLTNAWTIADAGTGGLTHSEYEYLRALERLDGAQVAKSQVGTQAGDDGHDGHHLRDLTVVLGVRKASASVAVAKLEKRGLIQRFPCEFDARAQHFVLTKQAQSGLRAQEEAVYGVAAAKVESLLSRDEQATLCSLLRKITADDQPLIDRTVARKDNP